MGLNDFSSLGLLCLVLLISQEVLALAKVEERSFAS